MLLQALSSFPLVEADGLGALGVDRSGLEEAEVVSLDRCGYSMRMPRESAQSQRYLLLHSLLNHHYWPLPNVKGA